MNPSLKRFGRVISNSLNGNPAIRAVKNFRNELIDHSFRCRSSRRGKAFAGELSDREVRRVAVAVAFNSPWVVDLLTAAWQKYPVGLDLIVIDNSNDEGAREMHAEICRNRDVPYLGLPWNGEWSPNRSHGNSMNWVWYNIIRHLDLEIAGYIDHDCFPIQPFDLPSRMEGIDVYGLRSDSQICPGAWALWAGYCFFRTHLAGTGRIDFKHRIEFGLDTGGGNWPRLFSRLEPGAVGSATLSTREIDPGNGLPPVQFEFLDNTFLHLRGASYRHLFRDPLLREQLVASIRREFLD